MDDSNRMAVVVFFSRDVLRINKGEVIKMVRNFYISGEIDGYKTILGGDPACKDGGMELTITQRDDGGIIKALVINCYENNGELITKVIDGRTSETLAEIKTKK